MAGSSVPGKGGHPRRSRIDFPSPNTSYSWIAANSRNLEETTLARRCHCMTAAFLTSLPLCGLVVCDVRWVVLRKAEMGCPGCLDNLPYRFAGGLCGPTGFGSVPAARVGTASAVPRNQPCARAAPRGNRLSGGPAAITVPNASVYWSQGSRD